LSAYIIRRLFLIIPTLFLVTVIVFITARLIPGNVIDLMIADQREVQNLWDRAQLEHELGLDTPVHIQYVRWIGGIFRGDMGESLWTEIPVMEEVSSRLPVSAELGLLALILGQLIALPIGVYSAIRQDSPGDYFGRSMAIIFIAVPSFWVGTMIMVFPALWWNWSPPMRYIPFFDDPMGNLAQFVLPAIILGMVMSGTTMRMTRTMMLEVLRQDYIRTAWAKGLRERTVVIRHALKNALIPVVTIVGMQLPILIGGSVVLEQIFCLPGIGRYLLSVINKRDYPVISGINLIMASFVLIVNLVVDLTYAFLDPRIQYS
jgi:peptide/nickel transport system permease protein